MSPLRDSWVSSKRVSNTVFCCGSGTRFGLVGCLLRFEPQFAHHAGAVGVCSPVGVEALVAEASGALLDVLAVVAGE